MNWERMMTLELLIIDYLKNHYLIMSNKKMERLKPLHRLSGATKTKF